MTVAKKEIITAATDFSEAGDYAIDNATSLANTMHASITVLHVLNKQSQNKLRKDNKDRSHLENKLADTADKIRKISALDADYKLLEGSIYSAIPKHIGQTETSYLFLGTTGKRGKQLLIGSSLLKIIKKSSIPVVVAQKPAAGNKFKNIVYPLNTDIGSKQKIKWAIDLNKYAGSVIHIFVDNPKLEGLKVKLKADLHQLQNILDLQGTPYTVTHASGKGSFVGKIFLFTKEQQTDAIMISTNPEKINWALFRSAEEKVIYNKEKIPVICVNSKDFKRIVGGL